MRLGKKYIFKITTCAVISIVIFELGLLTNVSIYGLNGNVTLTAEQINEVDKDPLAIIQGCSHRLGLKLDPGKLCDAFSTYLHDKCERLDYLSEYCGPLAVYFPKRIIQKQCISNPPLPNDIGGVEKCLTYINFNSTYSNLSLKITLKSIQFSRNDASIKTIFSVINPNIIVINLLSISYDITMHGEKIASGGVGDVKSTVMDCPAYCFDIKSLSSRDFAIPLGVSSSILTQGSFPYIVNGTYRYENSSSDTVSKQFNFTSQ